VTLSQPQYTVNILDNELPPKLSMSDALVTESDTDNTNAIFNLRLSAPSAVPVRVSFTTTNGSAIGGLDFVTTNGVLSFAPGETNVVLGIAVLGDVLSESNEFFSVRLFNPTNATLTDALGRATIQDNDPLPALSISDAAVAENAAGPTNAIFTVSLNATSGRTVTVKFSTAAGTASSGADFVPKAGSLTFLPGTTRLNIPVAVNRDALTEPEETFFVNLSSPINATLLNAQAVGTILSPAPSTFGAVTIKEARFVGARFCLRFTTQPGTHYVVECSHRLEGAAEWKPLPGAENVSGTGAVAEICDDQSEGRAKCFYRVRTLP
jgi:hypothetical protein